MTTQQKVDVMLAYIDGKDVQCRSNKEPIGPEIWLDYPRAFGEPGWNWSRDVYRVKPDPEPTIQELADKVEALSRKVDSLCSSGIVARNPISPYEAWRQSTAKQ